jgi:hypothetical protein
MTDQLVESLLYEGYALYPYTAGATKNATPTPFGIVYPPAYAAGLDSAFDYLRVECLIEAEPDARLAAEVRYLVPSGPRHEAAPRAAALPETALADLAAAEVSETFDVDGIELRLRLSASPPHRGQARAMLWVENRTRLEGELDRRAALGRALLSTHPILRVRGGRFVSPLEAGPSCASVNTFPVLASARDDVLLGAAIVLPDHPQIAPESRGGLFDSTEIEEALLLHVQALSDTERAAIAAGDPAVRAMIERAETATPDDLLRLHGRVTVRDAPDPTLGEPEAQVGDVVIRRGASVVLRPGPRADLHARMAAGRRATVEKILVDYDGKVHVGVTVDADPGQQLLRETGRFLYFFADELEVAS